MTGGSSARGWRRRDILKAVAGGVAGGGAAGGIRARAGAGNPRRGPHKPAGLRKGEGRGGEKGRDPGGARYLKKKKQK